MIYLDPPYQVIAGYTVLSDHADPNLYYVLPAAPTLAAADGARPAFTLLQYQGGGAGAAKVEGGLLTLTTELAVPDTVLPLIRSRLAQRQNRPAGELRLMPVLFDGGTVELVALGATSGVPAAPPAGDGASGGGGAGTAPAAPAPSGPFSVRFLGSGKPSLGGNNTATFQLVLDALAAELIEGVLDAPDIPLIAIYRMTFAGLRPSFQIKVEADWNKVYRSLQQKAKANVYYVAADVDTMISDTLEQSNIRIDTTVFGVGDSARGAAERARKQLTDWVMERLFQPMTDPKAATANAIGQVIDDTVWSLARTVLPGVSYRLREVDETQVRLMSARMDESVAERREVVPQGTLGGLINRYRVDPTTGRPKTTWPALRETLVQKVALNGFPRLEVQVGSEDRFAADGVTEVRVDLARLRGDGTQADPKTVAFRSAAEHQPYVVNLLGEGPPPFPTPYQYRMAVTFNPAGPFGPHPPAQGDWQPGTTAELVVEPRLLYTVREVQVGVAPTFSFSQFPVVTVELRDPGAGGPTPMTGRIRLTPEQATGVWRYRSFAAQPQPYEYRATYHRAPESGGNIEGPWQPQMDDWLAVADPLPAKRTLNLFVTLPWPTVAVAYVQLRYRDEAHGISMDEQMDLAADKPYLRRDYPIAAGGPRTLAYRLTLLLTTGELLEGSWRETEDDRLVVDRRLVERRVITVRAIGGSLADNRLSEVRVSLQARDAQGGAVRAETEIRLTADGPAPPPWEYLLGDPPVRTLHYRAVFVDNNGFVTQQDWTPTEADLLVVQLRTKTITA